MSVSMQLGAHFIALDASIIISMLTCAHKFVFKKKQYNLLLCDLGNQLIFKPSSIIIKYYKGLLMLLLNINRNKSSRNKHNT